MIRILNEADNNNNNDEFLTDDEILALYTIQKSRISDRVQLILDNILETLSNSKDIIVQSILREYISNYYFDKDELVIVDADDDFEDRLNEIKDIKTLAFIKDNVLEYNIKETIKNII